MNDLTLIIHNIRSGNNVGSLMRSAEGLGVSKVFMTGYTPYPLEENDTRLPHITRKNSKEISKTALGAEKNVDWSHFEDILLLIKDLKKAGYRIVALEQDPRSTILSTSYRPSKKLALIVGNEVRGVEHTVLNQCDEILEIYMMGKKESLNVASAGAIAIFTLTNSTTMK